MGAARKQFQEKLSTALVIVIMIQFLSGCMEQTPTSIVTESSELPPSLGGCVTAEDGSTIPNAEVTFPHRERSLMKKDASPLKM